MKRGSINYRFESVNHMWYMLYACELNVFISEGGRGEGFEGGGCFRPEEPEEQILWVWLCTTANVVIVRVEFPLFVHSGGC